MPFKDEILDLGAHDDDDNLEEEAMFYEVNKSCDYLTLIKMVSLVKRCQSWRIRMLHSRP